MPKLHRFTKGDFARFVEQVGVWLVRFGVSEWQIDYRHEQLAPSTSAEVEFDNEGKSATFRLNECVESSSDHLVDVDALALHEVLHLILADFAWVASRSRDRDEIVISHEHEVINRLMRVLKPCRGR